MPSSEPDELLDSWLGDGVDGLTISAVCRNLVHVEEGRCSSPGPQNPSAWVLLYSWLLRINSYTPRSHRWLQRLHTGSWLGA